MPSSASQDTRPPAFQFYPKDFLTDSNVVVMSLQERGAYITLICQCWIEGAIPANPDKLARLCGVPATTFRKLWPALQPCFEASRRDTGQLIHPRLERERRKQIAWRTEQSERGKSGAEKRWRKHSDAMPTPSAKNGVATFSPMAKNGSSSSSASSSAFPDLRQAAAAPVNARSKRPIYTSDRFAVFEWQLDELSKMLGAHFEAFDLHAFFDSLSRQSRDSGLVIPKADAWPWLQAQVLAEAKRRNLPMASAVAPTRDRAAEQRAQDEKILALIQEGRRAGR